jgi:hypothetical protein
MTNYERRRSNSSLSQTLSLYPLLLQGAAVARLSYLDALIIFGVLYQEYLLPRTFPFSDVFSTRVASLRPEAIDAVSPLSILCG